MTAPAREILPLRPGQAALCESILRSVPEWFGIEESLLMYARETAALPAWICFDRGEPAGFIAVKQHFPGSAEVFVIAVAGGRHRRGIGRALITTAAAWARGQSCSLLFVKTMGPSRPSPEYAQTLKFYLAAGFVPLEEFRKEWGAIPCLVLAKNLLEPRA